MKSIHEMGRKLVAQGFDVTVFTTNADGLQNLDVPLGVEVLIDGVKVHYFPVEWPRNYFRCPTLAHALQQRVSEFDIVHINWLYVYSTLIAARACHSQGVPYLLAPRGMLDPNAIALHGALKKKLYLTLVERSHLHNAAAVHFTSIGERDQAIRSGWRIRPVVVPNGVDLWEYPLTQNSELFPLLHPNLFGKRIILFLGRINYIKGLNLLVKALPIIVRSIPDAHLVLAGPDDTGYVAEVEKWLIEENVLENVTFTGMLLHQDKLTAFAGADVFVAPSYLESFGMAIVEAMACSLPVVITDRVNICREIEQAGAGVVVPCDPVRIAEALVGLLKDPARSREMGRKGRRFVEQTFTWDAAAHLMSEVYQDIVLIGKGRK